MQLSFLITFSKVAKHSFFIYCLQMDNINTQQKVNE